MQDNNRDSHPKDVDPAIDSDFDEQWDKYLELRQKGKIPITDPFDFKAKDLHVDNCLRVVPNQYKERIKFAVPEAPRDYFFPELRYDYSRNLKLFATGIRPNFDNI